MNRETYYIRSVCACVLERQKNTFNAYKLTLNFQLVPKKKTEKKGKLSHHILK